MRPSRLLACLALLLPACGLSDYEARMLDAQQRVQRFEEESRLLEKAVQIPNATNKAGEKVPAANVFFRPPRGIDLTASNESAPRAGKLYTYRPRSERAANPFVFVELAFGAGGKEFASEVMQAFTAPGDLQWRERQVSSPSANPEQKGQKYTLTFNTAEFEDSQYFYSINLTRTSHGQAAVVYWLDRANRGGGTRAMQASLESFAADAEAAHRRALLPKGSPLHRVPAP